MGSLSNDRENGSARWAFGALLALWTGCANTDPPSAPVWDGTSAASAPDAGAVTAIDGGSLALLDAALLADDATNPRVDAGPAIDDGTLQALAAQLVVACPVAAANDAAARERCATGLTDLALLRGLSSDPFLWGAQPADMPLEQVPHKASLTSFNSRVWRRIYLSTLMFEGPFVIESAGRYRALKVPSRFRNELDAGDYPYPFWHAEKKWTSYEQAKYIVFLFEGTRLIAAVRSSELDGTRAHSVRTWDGAWTWNDGQEPRVTLFRALFSQTNPFVAPLDESYRALAVGLREQTCLGCHSPNNAAMIKSLDLLNFPNQSLSGRHRIVTMLDRNQMPPDIGIKDESVRLSLLRRAQDFARLGDQALAFEGEPIGPAPHESE